MAGSDLRQETIAGLLVYLIPPPPQDQVDYYSGVPNPEAVQRRVRSGWWGSQCGGECNDKHVLSAILEKKSGCSADELQSPGVYMHVDQTNRQYYVGSAIDVSILERQNQHLMAASSDDQNVGEFELLLRKHFSESAWYFCALPMKDKLLVDEKQRELILSYQAKEIKKDD